MYRNKKFGVEMLVFNDVDFLEANLRSMQPFIDIICVSVADQSWFGNFKNNGEAEKIVLKLQKEFDNIKLLKGNWKTEAEQRNDALKFLAETDIVFIIDADEMWPSGAFRTVKDFIIDHPGYRLFSVHWNTRFKNINWRVEPREPFKPYIAIDNKHGIEFFQNRLVKSSMDSANILIPEKLLIIEHFSYVRSDNQKIKEKLQSFSHANEIIGGIDWYYENIYLQADLLSVNFHPCVPECYSRLIVDKLHPDIKNSLKKYAPKIFGKQE